MTAAPDTSDPGFRIRGLGEIAIRCTDVARMTAFYRDVLRLEVLKGNSRPDIVFFRIAPGVAGHTAVLALFAADRPTVAGEASRLHHIALSLPIAEQAAARAWLMSRGLPVHVEEFPWIGWRGLFTRDPEGNTVELVAFDPGLAP